MALTYRNEPPISGAEYDRLRHRYISQLAEQYQKAYGHSWWPVAKADGVGPKDLATQIQWLKQALAP